MSSFTLKWFTLRQIGLDQAPGPSTSPKLVRVKLAAQLGAQCLKNIDNMKETRDLNATAELPYGLPIILLCVSG